MLDPKHTGRHFPSFSLVGRLLCGLLLGLLAAPAAAQPAGAPPTSPPGTQPAPATTAPAGSPTPGSAGLGDLAAFDALPPAGEAGAFTTAPAATLPAASAPIPAPSSPATFSGSFDPALGLPIAAGSHPRLAEQLRGEAEARAEELLRPAYDAGYLPAYRSAERSLPLEAQLRDLSDYLRSASYADDPGFDEAADPLPWRDEPPTQPPAEGDGS